MFRFNTQLSEGEGVAGGAGGKRRSARRSRMDGVEWLGLDETRRAWALLVWCGVEVAAGWSRVS